MDDNVYAIPGDLTENGTKAKERNAKCGIINEDSKRRNASSAKGNTYEVITRGIFSDGDKQPTQMANVSPLYESLKSKSDQNNMYDKLENRNISNKCQVEEVQKKNVRKHWLFCFIGIAIGAVLASTVVFFVLKYNKPDKMQGSLGNSSFCIWTKWSESSKTSGSGIPQRKKQQTGSEKPCDSNTDTETMPCYRNCTNSEVKLDMKFDPNTLHSSRYLSNDNTVLGNQRTPLTPKTNRFGTLKTYTGVMADRCFKSNTKIYYEVEYSYTINIALTSTNLILEIGLAQKDQVDNYDFVGNEKKGWSFVLARCGDIDNVCLRAKHNKKLEVNSILSKNVVGLMKSGSFGVYIDRTRNIFSLVMGLSIISFKNVYSDFELCPVFGVHNKPKTNVTLLIKNTRNVTGIPFEL